MNENDMSVTKNCPHCKSENYVDDQQPDFDWLQVNRTVEHDQTLVHARMLDVVSSTESRKTTSKSSKMSTRRNSDYWLKRFMASFDKMRSFLKRRPRAVTHMEALDSQHALASALEPLARCSSY